MRFFLDKHQQLELLYYETGFEQLQPIPPIHAWMEERGWEYYKDWTCVKAFNDDLCCVYYLEFKDDKMAVMFWLRWT
jgi:hypothetical protein